MTSPMAELYQACAAHNYKQQARTLTELLHEIHFGWRAVASNAAVLVRSCVAAPAAAQEPHDVPAGDGGSRMACAALTKANVALEAALGSTQAGCLATIHTRARFVELLCGTSVSPQCNPHRSLQGSALPAASKKAAAASSQAAAWQGCAYLCRSLRSRATSLTNS